MLRHGEVWHSRPSMLCWQYRHFLPVTARCTTIRTWAAGFYLAKYGMKPVPPFFFTLTQRITFPFGKHCLMKNEFLSTQDLGSLLGVTRQTIRNWIKKGEIQAFQIGQNLKIPIDEAVRLIRQYGLPFPHWLKEKSSHSADVKSHGEGTWPMDQTVETSVADQVSSKRISRIRDRWNSSARNGR